MLGHELRNPLSAVRNAVVTARLDPSRRDRALEIASRSADQLGQLVDDRLDIARFKRLLEQRFLAFRRFRQKAVDTPGGAFWVADREFDLDDHVQRIALPKPGGRAELQALVSDLASTPLDHDKPLWQFHVVQRYGRGSALITRIHHCYADGIALVQVLLSLTEAKLAPEKEARLTKVWFKEDRGSVFERLVRPTRAGVKRALGVGERALAKTRELLEDPQQIADILREGGEIARELAIALALPDDPPTALRGELGAAKRVAWADRLPLPEVKTLGRALRVTVNDLLLAAATGALRGYLLARGEDIDGVTIRATVPVNLRPLEHAKKLGNHFGLVFLELPIGEANPMRRLDRISEQMKVLRRSRQAIVAFGLLAALGMAPPAVQRTALELFSRKATAVATNVPGPPMPLYFAGSRIDDLMFWVPQTGSIGIGLSILSYNGQVHFGLISDAGLVPDPDAVIARFAGEFEKLVLIALMSDWSDGASPADAADVLAASIAAARRPRRKPPRKRAAPRSFRDAIREFRETTSPTES
jgi:WS/DGAT/MGAT family acyltransferase